VHAAGQVVDFWLPPTVRLPLERLPAALAPRLPPDIVVASAWGVDPRFHARLDARSKRYRYLLWRRREPSPFWAGYAWHRPEPLDVAAMAQAAAALIGRRDLSAFAGAARPVRDAVRTIFDCGVWSEGPWLAVEVEADGFLYRMVRSIAGTLWRVGTGALTPEGVAALVAARRRADAGPSLPAHGLCLLWVGYPPEAGLPAPGSHAWPPPPGPPSARV
jgi:tRNA pseudouridine38-40 synthase